MSEDSFWPRALTWLIDGTAVNGEAIEAGDDSRGGAAVDLAIVGVPAHLTLSLIHI